MTKIEDQGIQYRTESRLTQLEALVGAVLEMEPRLQKDEEGLANAQEHLRDCRARIGQLEKALIKLAGQHGKLVKALQPPIRR